VKYATSFGAGVALAAVILAVAAASRHAEDAAVVDDMVAALGLVLAFALATGLNLGMWIAIRSLDDYGHSLVAPGAALCVALCAIALFLSGLLTAAIAA